MLRYSLQLPKLKPQATELIGTGGIVAVAVYLIDHPDAGAAEPGLSTCTLWLPPAFT